MYQCGAYTATLGGKHEISLFGGYLDPASFQFHRVTNNRDGRIEKFEWGPRYPTYRSLTEFEDRCKANDDYAALSATLIKKNVELLW